MDINKTTRDVDSLQELMYETASEDSYVMSVRIEAAKAFALLAIVENMNEKKEAM